MPGRVRKGKGPGSLSKEEAWTLKAQRGCVTEGAGGWAFGAIRTQTGSGQEMRPGLSRAELGGKSP